MQVLESSSQLTMWGVSLRRRPSTPAQYRAAFIKRTRALRVASGRQPAEVAEALGVKLDTYGKWEPRTLLPHHLLMPFCEATGSDPWVLLTGRPFSLGRSLPPTTDRLAS